MAKAGTLAIMKAQGPRANGASPQLRRFVLLLVCVALGLVVALAGVYLTGSSTWFVAVPAAVAIGWLFVADPTRCEPPARGRRRDADDNGPAA